MYLQTKYIGCKIKVLYFSIFPRLSFRLFGEVWQLDSWKFFFASTFVVKLNNFEFSLSSSEAIKPNSSPYN